MKGKYTKLPSFLFPNRLIKSKHFSKKDVRAVKSNLVKSFSFVYLLAGVVLILLSAGLLTYTAIETKGNVAEKYGLLTMIGMIGLIVGSLATIGLVICSKLTKNKNKSTLLARIGADLLFASVALYMMFCIYSDAEMGFTVHTEAASAAIVLVAVLLLIQPMYWVDALILDIGTSLGIIAVTIYCQITFGMEAAHYYILIALIFPLCCYLVIAILFYAETQRYKEVLENERLHNTAYYDSLTHCKNRYALNEFLSENQARWENKDNLNLLLVIFDIDDFHLYNSEFSHLGGDFCLKSICEAIRHEFSSPNLDFFRYGGEEFLLFFEMKNQNEAMDYLRRIKFAINKLDISAPKGAPKTKVTISIGGLLINNVQKFVFEEQMTIVDRYLYQAKESGKDAICYNGSIMH